MKLTVIGGGGKISSAAIYELLNDLPNTPLEIVLYGRNPQKIANTLALSEQFNQGNAQIRAEADLEQALSGADIVFYCATYGTENYEGYRSMGIANGAFLMAIGEKMHTLCPDAWFLVTTNPPDIPLAAIGMRFGLKKLIGLCNAPVFNRKMLASYLKCEEASLTMREVGVNHEYWYYDLQKDGASIYDELRKRLPKDYNEADIDGQFHRDFPEWKKGFVNNAALVGLTGYLSGPVGGSNRYNGLPLDRKDMWAVSSRPTAADFEALMAPGLSKEDIFRTTRRCAAGFPQYIAGILESILTDDGREHPMLAQNLGAWEQYPADVFLQMTCALRRDGLTRPDLSQVPEFIEATLASRILQNHLMAQALAQQDDTLVQKALLVYPERLACMDAEDFFQTHKSVEPMIQLD